jgi:hypothetical protein
LTSNGRTTLVIQAHGRGWNLEHDRFGKVVRPVQKVENCSIKIGQEYKLELSLEENLKLANC